MSTPINDGGPAFPFPADHTCNGNNGMSLRDWFAGKALAGWIAATPSIDGTSLNGTAEHGKSIAQCSYRYADAMLAEREKCNKEAAQ